MSDKDIKLLKDNGWIIVCQAPFEIEDEDGADFGIATGTAAWFIFDTIKNTDKK